jgi:FixJ family two-component response regulator
MIYLIDDDPSVRRGFEIFLKSSGDDYTSFETAEEFLAQYKPGFDDLLVLDLTLQGMTGYDLLKKLDQLDIKIPVIVVTSLEEPGTRESCRKYGVKAFLRKPIDGEALLDLIKYNIQ